MNFVKWLGSFFEDHRGGGSWSRGASTGVLVAIFYPWVSISIEKAALQPLDPNLMILVGAALGITAAKSAMGEKGGAS